MNKYLAVAIILFQASCATEATVRKKYSPLNFSTAKSLWGRVHTQEEIDALIGPPFTRQSDDPNRWTYTDSDGFQRMMVDFNEEKTIDAILWIPRIDEPEAHIDSFKRLNPKLNLSIEKIDEIARPHTSATETTYSDGGPMIILHNDQAHRIEAIAWTTDKKARKPSEVKQESPRPLVEF